MKKIALIGDIIDSRRIEDRAKTQRCLEKVFQLLHRNAENLVSSFTITLGDEFQAVFSNSNDLLYYMLKIESSVFPVKIRYSLGVGNIITPIKKQAIGMDGPAFYYAREGMIKLKSSRGRIKISGEIEDIDLINLNFELLSFLTKDWKLNKYLIFELLYMGKPVKQIAKKLKITERAVYKTINSGGIQIIKALSDEISVKLNKNLELD